MVCGDDRYGANGHIHLRLVTRSDDHPAGVHDEIHIFRLFGMRRSGRAHE